MNDNEFSVPFERAFKRLRVNGDDLPNDNSDNDDYFKNKPLIKNNNDLLNETSLDKVPSNANLANEMWRSIDKLTVNENSKPSFNQQTKLIDKNNLDNRLNFESKCNFLLNDLKKASVKSTSSTELAQNCSHQARNESDITVDELAGYLDLQLYLPKKMSFMAELAYS